MEKRAILAIVLSLLVVVLWSMLFAPTPPPKGKHPAEQGPSKRPQKATEVTEKQAKEARLPQPSPAVPVSGGSSVHESLVTIDTGITRMSLTSRGAGVKTVQLLEYRATLDKGAPPVEIAPVHGAAVVPLRAEVQVGQRRLSLAHVDFTPSQTTLVLSAEHPQGTVVFRGRLANGLVVRRTYRFYYNSYLFEVRTQIEGLPLQTRSAMTLFWGPGLRQSLVKRSRQRGIRPRSYIDGKIFHEVPKKVGEVRMQRGKVTWAALADTYFAAVLLPVNAKDATVFVRRVQKDALELGLSTPLNGQDPTQIVRVYVGPKLQKLLESVEPSLGKLIDLGFFSPLARPMLQLLRLVNSVIHNYGVSIILVTILIRVVFWPLTQKSYKSMQAMQKLQPKMKELQVLYKDDKQALNRAMMQLYREHKVNPMGGCLPMLLQVPFFFAFYNALLYAIELRHAPFICWEKELFWVGRGICDLSVHDPSYITPILMGISMFVQQKMSPTTGDPTQAKITQFMPLIFLLFFLKAPAGLVIYWLMSNVLSILQQVLINRTRRLETVKAAVASKGK